MALAVLVGLACMPAAASAGTYTVLSCDAAFTGGYSSEAWVPAATVGSTYSLCPSRGEETRGISDRAVDLTASALGFAAHSFTAPPGTSITSLRWGGRLMRGHCSWGALIQALPSRAQLVGLSPNRTCGTSGLDIRGQSLAFPTPAGTTSLQQIVLCGQASCPPGATLHTHVAAVTLSDPTLPSIALGGPMITRRWLSGDQSVSLVLRDNTGIARFVASLGTDVENIVGSCSYARTRPCIDVDTAVMLSTTSAPAGRNTLVVIAIDAAGNVSRSTYPVDVDNEPPARVRPALEGGEAWRRTNGFVVHWPAPAEALAPVVAARYRLCSPSGCFDGRLEGRNVNSLGRFLLSQPGEHTLQVWLEDEAGNQSFALSASDPLRLRLDQEAPRVTFDAPNPADPLRIAARVEDRLSGLDTGEIEMRRRGGDTWNTLATAREGQSLVAYVDDERFRSGGYEFRARARDVAGNESSTDRRADGSQATLDLPVRFTTRLSVGVRVSKGRGKERRVSLRPEARVRYGRRLKLTGRLENADGQPIDGATLEVSADSPGDDTGLLPAGQARTDRSGRFTYIVRGSRNKVVRFRYAGSRRIRSATRDFALHVRAASTIAARPRRLRNGQTVRLSGRVLSRPLPASGKLIEVQAFFRDRWRTFSTTRANSRGRWRFDYQFGGTRGRVPYRLRASLPAEGGYPFATGRSRVVRVIVVG